MSHVVKIDFRVSDLSALASACEQLGLELVKDQKTHRWYGRWENDYDDPERAAYLKGRDPKTYGKCEHAIRIKNKPFAYEIGIVATEDGKAWELVYDAFGGALEQVAGKDLGRLKGEYGLEIASQQLQSEGWMVQRMVDTATGLPYLDMSQ